MRAWIIALHPEEAARVGRTARSLHAAGMPHEVVWSHADLRARLDRVRDPVLLANAGAWLVRTGPLTPIPPSATGRPLMAFGATRQAPADAPSPAAAAWQRLLAKCGGDLERRSVFAAPLPSPDCVYLEPGVARAWQLGGSWRAFRKVHLAQLDVFQTPQLRVLQVVTSIQFGGAERVTIDLAHELNRRGIATAVAALGKPSRAAFPTPRHFFELSRCSREPAARAAAIAQAAREFGADLVHGHLLTAAEARALRAHDLPLVMTLHNLPPAWPAGCASLQPDDVDLLLACSHAVEKAVADAGLKVATRTVWNGIDPSPDSRGDSWRPRCGWAARDFVIAAIANPRQQKRQHRLPAILEAVQSRLGERKARLLIVGAPARGSADAQTAAAQLHSAILASPLRAHIHHEGATADVAGVLANADALLSVSAFEGLSLVHLEALAAGLPVIATDAGGTREIAQQSPSLRVLPIEADDAAFAEALAAIAQEREPRTTALPPSFTRAAMAARTASLYPRILARRSVPRDGLWLITNNFSTGGAQSSARRLLTGLTARGVKVRAAVIEENPQFPTPGRAALLHAGIPMLAVPPPSALDAPEAVARVLAAMDADPPRAVLFWNLIAVFKVLLADASLDVPIFDVSPGEMYFTSLSRYFANPRPALPYRDAREYGARLAGVVVKYDAEREAASQILGVPVHMIRNGVALHSPAGPRRRGSRLVIGTAARLSPDKRLGDLFAAIRLAAPQLPPFVLKVAGGPERGHESHSRELRALSRGLPIEWCGESPDVNEFLTSLDLFVAISEPSGCPNASLEAMAAGVPVIATAVGGAREQIIHDRTGLLTPPRNAAALAAAILQLARDPARRAAFVSAAREHIAGKFSLAQMLDAYSQLCGLTAVSAPPAPAPATLEAERMGAGRGGG